MRAMLLLSGVLVLAACKPVESPTFNTSTGSTPTPANVSAAIDALPPAQRDAVLLRAIMDADLPCQKIEKAERMSTPDGKMEWRATCDGGTQHLVDIQPNGSATVVSRIHS
jgi:hypothetical protein